MLSTEKFEMQRQCNICLLGFLLNDGLSDFPYYYHLFTDIPPTNGRAGATQLSVIQATHTPFKTFVTFSYFHNFPFKITQTIDLCQL